MMRGRAGRQRVFGIREVTIHDADGKRFVRQEPKSIEPVEAPEFHDEVT